MAATFIMTNAKRLNFFLFIERMWMLHVRKTFIIDLFILVTNENEDFLVLKFLGLARRKNVLLAQVTGVIRMMLAPKRRSENS